MTVCYTTGMRLLRISAALLLAATALAASPVEAATYDRFQTKTVTVGTKKFTIELLTVDLRNPKLKVKTYTGTNDTNCFQRPCRVRSLQSFVKETNGFAGINGSYFCPKDYAACAGENGSFYWMMYNRRKQNFVNSYQNQFNKGGLFAFFKDRTWKFYPETRPFTKEDIIDTIDPSFITGAISNGPTLISNSQNILKESTLDTKQRTVKSNRSGMGMKGSTLYLMVARGATVPDLGRIMKAMKIEQGLNLDGGGSSAIWYRGGYKVGPGRDIANALVFTER